MTSYSDWRNYGFVSRLSEVLVNTGPGASGNINSANAISGQQLGVASQAGQQQQQLYGQAMTAIQPYLQQQSALAGGNRQAALAAAMPVISQISGGYQGAKQQIMNSLPPGAARDTALAQLETQKATGIGTAQANMVQQAPQNLAALGGTLGGMSLQELGAQLSGLSGGAQTNYQAGQMAAAQQQSMLQFFGGLAKDVTSLVPGLGSLGGSSMPGGGGSGYYDSLGNYNAVGPTAPDQG